MSESERRRNYHYNRVLIESARILDPQFHDAVVFLSGAQIEMLRNITQYLNRQETYVSEYHPGYYLMPTVADYDDLLEIVADLEETLMGNPNTIWGYKDRYHISQDNESDLVGTYTVNLPKPTAGTIHRILGVSLYRAVGVGTTGRVQVMIPGGAKSIEDVPMAIAGLCYANTCDFIVTDADNIRILYRDCVDEEFLYTSAWGYVMVVPE